MRGRWAAGWRGAALLPAATLAVHELRYLLAFGRGASRELTDRGDTYLGWLAPLCVVLLAIPLGALAGRLAAAWQGRPAGRGRGGRGRLVEWLALAFVLVGCFCAQEVLEQLLEPRHPLGLTGIFGDGGWWAVPAALGVAAVLTLLIVGTQAAIAGLARRRSRPVGPRRASVVRRRPRGLPRLVPVTPLAGGAAGRAPPRRVATPRTRP